MQFNNIGKGALFSEGDGTFTGNVEIDGEKIRIGGVRRTTQQGRTIYAVQEEVGALFQEQEKKAENSPDFTGSCTISGKEVRIAAWNSTTKEGKDYLSIKVSEKSQDRETDVQQPAKVNQDEIPF
mgnify:CR=1 FL=1|jgi:uncharacterized protein (DUF736 family)